MGVAGTGNSLNSLVTLTCAPRAPFPGRHHPLEDRIRPDEPPLPELRATWATFSPTESLLKASFQGGSWLPAIISIQFLG